MGAPKVKITCRGSGFLKLDQMVDFQGNLKSLSDSAARKLRKSLLQYGISFPFFVWKNREKNHCLDGHQRLHILRKLKRQGYEIPPLPVDFIDAKDEHEAREKILLLSSQYGEMTEESLLEFLKESEIDLDDIQEKVDLPNIDLDKLLEEIENVSSPLADKDGNGKQYQVIVECDGQKEQTKLIAKLKKDGLRAHAFTLQRAE